MTDDDLASELCHEVRLMLDRVCTETMRRFDDKQGDVHRVEFAVVAYMMSGETAITLSASGAPWGLIAKAIGEAASEQQERSEGKPRGPMQ